MARRKRSKRRQEAPRAMREATRRRATRRAQALQDGAAAADCCRCCLLRITGNAQNGRTNIPLPQPPSHHHHLPSRSRPAVLQSHHPIPSHHISTAPNTSPSHHQPTCCYVCLPRGSHSVDKVGSKASVLVSGSKESESESEVFVTKETHNLEINQWHQLTEIHEVTTAENCG